MNLGFSQSRLDDVTKVGPPEPREQWDFTSKGTQDSTHGLHPYVAAMNPHLARELLKRLVPAGGAVLDPFVGGGAVLVEATLNGMHGEGLDVNPLAVLISKVKTTHVPEHDLSSWYRRIIEQFPEVRVEPPAFPRRNRIDFWFKPYTLEPLAKLRKLIDQVEDDDARDVFRVVFSATARDVSLTYRGEVRLRRLQGGDFEKFHPDILSKFRERAELAIQRVPKLPPHRTVTVRKGTATRMNYADDEFSAIVCSPPYGDDRNGVGYFQFSKNMLFWLGYTDDQLRADKAGFLGELKDGKIPPDIPALESVLVQIKANPIPSNPRAVEECIAFYHDYDVALKEMARVCSGGIAIVIGDRRLSSVFIDNARITTELMKRIGYKLSKRFFRTIEKKRIAVMQPGHGQRDRSGGGLIDKEHTLIFER